MKKDIGNIMNYTGISKSLGWDEQSCNIPSDKELEDIINKAENGCCKSFRTIMKINRFATSTKETRDRINKNYEAFIRLKDKF